MVDSFIFSLLLQPDFHIYLRIQRANVATHVSNNQDYLRAIIYDMSMIGSKVELKFIEIIFE